MLFHLLGPPPDLNRPILSLKIDWWRPVRQRGSQHENSQLQVSSLGGNFGLKNRKISILTKYSLLYCSTIPSSLMLILVKQ